MWGDAEPMAHHIHTDLGIDDLALASPGTGSAACSYHSCISFRNAVTNLQYMQGFLRASLRLDGAAA